MPTKDFGRKYQRYILGLSTSSVYLSFWFEIVSGKWSCLVSNLVLTSYLLIAHVGCWMYRNSIMCHQDLISGKVKV